MAQIVRSSFVRTAFGPNTAAGLEIIRIAEINSDRGGFWFGPERHSSQALTACNPLSRIQSCCCGAPYRLSFSYAGIDRNWHEEWREQIQLPKAIKLTVQDAATQRTLSISTAPLVHVEAPMECIGAKSLAECLASRMRPARIRSQR